MDVLNRLDNEYYKTRLPRIKDAPELSSNKQFSFYWLKPTAARLEKINVLGNCKKIT